MLSRFCVLIIAIINDYASFQFVMADNFYNRSKKEQQVNDVQYNSVRSMRLNMHKKCPRKLLVCCLRPD